MITATVTFLSKDGPSSMTFDATDYFSDVKSYELEDLQDVGWGGGRSGDLVAVFFDGREGYEEISEILEGVRKNGSQGFECKVDVVETLRWLSENKKFVYDDLCDRKECDLLSEAIDLEYDLSPLPRF